MRAAPLGGVLCSMFLVAACAAANDSEPEESACPVTIPNGRTPPGETAAASHHGNGAIWTALSPDGVMAPDEVRGDGSLAVKFPWWIARDPRLSTIGDDLTIRGRRIDRGPSRLKVEKPCCFTAEFQAISLVFPSAGCWSVTAESRFGLLERHTRSLTFVVRVVERPAT